MFLITNSNSNSNFMNSFTFKFPDDFEENPHKSLKGITHWRLLNPYNKEQMLCSIIGGTWYIEEFGKSIEDAVHGDGITTFEMWDKREEYPQNYLTKEEINEFLLLNPYTDLDDKNHGDGEAQLPSG